MKRAIPQATEPLYSDRQGLRWLTYPELDTPELVHGIAVFTRLESGISRDRWAEAAVGEITGNLEHGPTRVIIPAQAHTSTVRVVNGDTPHDPSVPCDGLVTAQPAVMIGVSVADCIPLFAVNRSGGVVGIAHCGWRGIASGIVEALFTCLEKFMPDPQGTTFVVGASIGRCCYDVGEDLLDRFPRDEAESFSRRSDCGKVFFDLKSLVAWRLEKLGVGPDKISIDKTCTSCNKYILSSYRASGGESGLMLAFLMFMG